MSVSQKITPTENPNISAAKLPKTATPGMYIVYCLLAAITHTRRSTLVWESTLQDSRDAKSTADSPNICVCVGIDTYFLMPESVVHSEFDVITNTSCD